MSLHLTDDLIPELAVKSGHSTLYMDTEVEGLGMAVSKHSRAWMVQYRMQLDGKSWRDRSNNRKVGRVCIGYYPTMSIVEARGLAMEIRAMGRQVHPSEHLRTLTGASTRGARNRGGLPRKPFNEKAGRSFHKMVEAAYLAVLEMRYAA